MKATQEQQSSKRANILAKLKATRRATGKATGGVNRATNRATNPPNFVALMELNNAYGADGNQSTFPFHPAKPPKVLARDLPYRNASHVIQMALQQGQAWVDLNNPESAGHYLEYLQPLLPQGLNAKVVAGRFILVWTAHKEALDG